MYGVGGSVVFLLLLEVRNGASFERFKTFTRRLIDFCLTRWNNFGNGKPIGRPLFLPSTSSCSRFYRQPTDRAWTPMFSTFHRSADRCHAARLLWGSICFSSFVFLPTCTAWYCVHMWGRFRIDFIYLFYHTRVVAEWWNRIWESACVENEALIVEAIIGALCEVLLHFQKPLHDRCWQSRSLLISTNEWMSEWNLNLNASISFTLPLRFSRKIKKNVVISQTSQMYHKLLRKI